MVEILREFVYISEFTDEKFWDTQFTEWQFCENAMVLISREAIASALFSGHQLDPLFHLGSWKMHVIVHTEDREQWGGVSPLTANGKKF